MRSMDLTILCAVLVVAAASPAGAQATRYNVKPMDFDLWCTEQAHLSYDRCDKRLPDDLQRFEAYRAVVERYEIPYLQEKEDQLRFNRDIMHNDPIDNPPQTDTSKPSTSDGKSP